MGLNVYFTGFMATGKSRIGEQVARMLGVEFLDTDRVIEESQSKSVSEIFEELGEAKFREIETETLEELAKGKNRVIALGGGTLTCATARDVIAKSGILVRLWAPVDVLAERVGRKNTRPLLAGLNDMELQVKIREMLDAREPYYSQADFSIESREDVPVETLARKIKSLVDAWKFKRVMVKTSQHDYPIFIGTDLSEHLKSILEGLELNTDFLMVSDENVSVEQHDMMRRLQHQAGNCKLFRFPAGEEFKTIQTLNRLFTFMLRKGYTRKTTLLQFSGGVPGDMAGFGAASYQRGIPFIQIPTSLLAMVDSSVGGKVAINHQLGKNMIGAFYQPRAVIINIDVLKTLPDEEYLAGLGEVIKYGVIWNPELFTLFETESEAILAKDPIILEKIIRKCCEIKAEVVSQDEKENGIRAILNYGHTFGHAIEKLTEYQKFSHGIAVSLGMRVAGRLASLAGLWSPMDEMRQEKLLNLYKFPKKYEVNKAAAWAAMGIDKKADRGSRVFILPTEIGKVQIVRDIDQNMIDKAWDAIL